MCYERRYRKISCSGFELDISRETEPTGARRDSSSPLTAKRLHRVDACRTARRQKGCEGAHGDEHAGDCPNVMGSRGEISNSREPMRRVVSDAAQSPTPTPASATPRP
jgi:hypothetical protein